MFISQAGGACDCGDTSVMKETGYVLVSREMSITIPTCFRFLK